MSKTVKLWRALVWLNGGRASGWWQKSRVSGRSWHKPGGGGTRARVKGSGLQMTLLSHYTTNWDQYVVSVLFCIIWHLSAKVIILLVMFSFVPTNKFISNHPWTDINVTLSVCKSVHKNNDAGWTLMFNRKPYFWVIRPYLADQECVMLIIRIY